MIRITVLFLILFPLISFGQSPKKPKPWSDKMKTAFYDKYNYGDKSENDKKVIDCALDKTSHKFPSLKQAENDVKYLPKIIEACSLSVYIPVTGQLTKQQEEIVYNEILHLVNTFRNESGGIPILKIDPDLVEAAKIQSDYMAVTNTLSHNQSGNIPYSTVSRRVSMVKTGDYKSIYSIGENVTYTGFDSEEANNPKYLMEIASELFEAWKASKGHRENMLTREFKHFGFAVTIRKDLELIYATQVFTEQ